MTVLSDVCRVAEHRAVLATGEGLQPEQVLRSLRGNWDVWPRGDGTELMGMARMPHVAILHGVDAGSENLKPIVASQMSQLALQAGIWRQIQIMPDTAVRRLDLPTDSTRDPFAPIEGRSNPDRACFVTKVLGHSPSDIARYHAHLQSTDEELGRMLVAKDFMTALQARPNLFDLPWPDKIKARWAKTGCRDRMPPAAALGIYAEFSRLAQNMTAHIRLSFEENGREIFLRSFLEAIPTMAGPATAPFAVSRVVELAPFHTTALLPSGEMLRSGDREACKTWSNATASATAITIALGGDAALAASRAPSSLAEAQVLAEGIEAHPRFWPEPRDRKGRSLQKGHPATWRGMNWRMHGAVNLLDLANQARECSARCRTGRERLPAIDRDVERAIAAILYCWIEAAHPAALPTALGPIIKAKEKALEGKDGRPKGYQLSDCERTLDALATGGSFGSTLCEIARIKLAALPPPGAEGYTARYRCHLWFDRCGDDIEHYVRHQRNAIRRQRALQKASNELVYSHFPNSGWPGRGGPLLNRRRLRRAPEMTSTQHAARVVQDCAMMMLPPATDPIHVVNAEPHRWAEPSKRPT